MPPVAERRSRGATLALPLLLAVGLYGVFYVGLDVRTVPQVKLTTPVPSVQALRAGRLRDAGAFQAHSTAEAAVKLQVRPRGSGVEAPAVTLRERSRSSDVEAPAPAPELAPVGRERERPLLSQRTPAWDRLREEGLFHDNSGYLRIEPQNADELAEKTFWEDRVKAEFHDGCRRVANNTKQCLPKLIIMGQFKAGTTALFDMLAQHPDVLLPRKTEELKWHEMCPLNKPACVIKEVNGFTRLSERQRWDERALFSRYHILPVQEDDDTRPVMEASPYYLSGMPDSFEDLTRFTRYIPGVKMIALVRNPVDRAFSEYIMFSEPPFKQNASGCGRGPLRARFETLAVEELAVASPALNEDGTLAHRCLTDSTKWQQVPRAAGQSDFRGRLLRWGEYQHYISLWMRFLGPDQLAVVRNEDMDAHPERVLAELQEWAGLRPAMLAPLHTNLAGCRGSIARGAWDAKKKAQADSGRCAGAGPWAAQKRVHPAAAKALQAHFAPHNAKLEELTGQNFDDWSSGISPVYLGKGKGDDGTDWLAAVAKAAARGGRESGATELLSSREIQHV